MESEVNQVECPVQHVSREGASADLVRRFNVLQCRFGALAVLGWTATKIEFRLSCRTYRMIEEGIVVELLDGPQAVAATTASRWVQAIASGAVRDEDGKLRIPVSE